MNREGRTVECEEGESGNGTEGRVRPLCCVTFEQEPEADEPRGGQQGREQAGHPLSTCKGLYEE